ncbi:hypothetical protein [Spirochaeta cellobiosiphila]|uniref:hypothetical protein n=1 Tax=Spirochaeta cellobiosiphila TaxID=504483 RepID=UPI0004199A46|nr:hypothetical protein [Spirochaeta cellobiosiphila]
MEVSLFTRILGLGGEDLTTEVLVYLLHNEHYTTLKKEVLTRIFHISILLRLKRLLA